MSDRPIVLLDVDGVLNVVCNPNEPPTDWPEYRTEVMNGYRITWAPALIERLRALHEAEEVEIRWLTTWWAKIPTLAPLGMPDLTVACNAEDYAVRNRWWKLQPAQRAYEEGRKLVWIDDDLVDQEAWRWGKSLDRERFLGVVPRWNHGITPDLMDAIEAFVRS